ncbi:MAG TPA: Fic family protein [bacterium]|nr:Fic family protein [bacterium]
MAKRVTGEYAARVLNGLEYRAFLPSPLPPAPPLEFDLELETARDLANRALGRLDGIGDILPDPDLFLYQYVRKEALLSSQIEGTQSSFSDLLLFELDEAPGVPIEDTREVSNYVAALDHGLARMTAGFPLSLALLRELHTILLMKGRGGDKHPGQIRTKSVWIGGHHPSSAEFVPPPAEALMDFLAPFEDFLLNSRMPVLIKAGLAHAQFETIHPFEDGNGRLGRLLITLILCAEAVLSEPTLYLSLYFKSRRNEYYDALQKVRTNGDWEGWMKFFLRGVHETSKQAVETARRLVKLFEKDVQAIQTLGRSAGTALRVHYLLKKHIIVSGPLIRDSLQVSLPTALSHLDQLEHLGIIREFTGKKRNRLFAYDQYLNILTEGTEPL